MVVEYYNNRVSHYIHVCFIDAFIFLILIEIWISTFVSIYYVDYRELYLVMTEQLRGEWTFAAEREGVMLSHLGQVASTLQRSDPGGGSYAPVVATVAAGDTRQVW